LQHDVQRAVADHVLSDAIAELQEIEPSEHRFTTADPNVLAARRARPYGRRIRASRTVRHSWPRRTTW
jgi:hypothetical protein